MGDFPLPAMFDETRGYLPSNPIKPPFSYGSPMVSVPPGSPAGPAPIQETAPAPWATESATSSPRRSFG